MTERLWLQEGLNSRRITLEWNKAMSSLSSKIREEIERKVAGLGDVIKFSRAFFAWTNINYGFIDIVIGIGRLDGRDGSFHLIIPSMPSESAWVEFRIDDACIGGTVVQETLAEVVEREDELLNTNRNHYYGEDTDVLEDNSEED
ncbi:MAG: hypothetical protein QXI52_02570 [Nitrososphaerota archaeon]